MKAQAERLENLRSLGFGRHLEVIIVQGGMGLRRAVIQLGNNAVIVGDDAQSAAFLKVWTCVCPWAIFLQNWVFQFRKHVIYYNWVFQSKKVLARDVAYGVVVRFCSDGNTGAGGLFPLPGGCC